MESNKENIPDYQVCAGEITKSREQGLKLKRSGLEQLLSQSGDAAELGTFPQQLSDD